MKVLELNNACKTFGEDEDFVNVLHDVNLTLEEGEFVAIVGFSGSGKSTLINLMAGLEKATRGSVKCMGEEVEGPSPERGIVFQNYSLLPWLTVEGNVSLSVNQIFKDKSKEERKQIVDKYIDMVKLTPARYKRPSELSGGMRQRVSVARALAVNPGILLLDEPLSALDALTRAELQDQVLELWQAEKKTIVLITNDVDEGIIMADRIIPMTLGPGATLGPSYEVTLPRPRDRRTMNHDPEYKRIRNEVMHYLNNLKKKETVVSKEEYPLPVLEPVLI